ncbi:MAG: GTPase HflX [Candidatus Cardinium sp.]|uniref:GTPase HflX n=1 Tax=Cardinium endosymbiont of Dermatophagoides farinae TaxID=2597823 RepID=UPI001182D872|nr:GTPase HflX [Cardinium endosymbiont of Dermatophagoides farinae]TSJ80504.1 GTPase HflX [Cardinium endosymbiont of Dermatophagoides farinae]UWW96467.1 MAG: GTPase HflX [Candidatus Cardinium sp.]
MFMHRHNQSNLVAYEEGKTAILVALVTPQQPWAKTEEYLTELAFLADTWRLKIVKKFIQRLDYPHGAAFVGKGKLEEIAAFTKAEKIAYAIFDDELSPSQARNLEKVLSCQILDRSLLILNIFSMRAQTKQARTQVELAQYQYLLPRLTRMWTHLSSQKGGSAGMRGPGEKELETDRRIIQHKITKLREKLASITQQCITRRKGRIDLVRVALVGYTNVGKSTLMQLLSKSDIVADNKLFATIDATVRKVVLNGHAFLLTDTVGFIRKLPHTLVECFKSTLEEIKEADLLLHIIDASHDSFQEQIDVVNQTLREIGADNLPRILVFNKIDIIEENKESIAEVRQGIGEVALRTERYSSDIGGYPAIFISATKGLHIDLLREAIIKEIERVEGSRYIKVSY